MKSTRNPYVEPGWDKAWQQGYNAALSDLQDRLTRANNSLMDLASEQGGAVEEHRIYGKAEGVRLALSYLQEYR